MNQQLPSWRTQDGQTLWLSGLIAAMEKLSRSEWRARPVDPRELVAVRARLARPAMVPLARGSRFSLRNEYGAYSPAICRRGFCPTSKRRSLSSSRAK